MDIATIAQALTLAGSGLSTTKQASDLISDLRSKLKKSGSANAEVDEIIHALKEQLMQAREDQLELRQQLYEINSSFEKEDAKATMRARYHFKTFAQGGVVLVCNEDETIDQIPEYVCADCYEKHGFFMPLQNMSYALFCNNCGNGFTIKSVASPTRRTTGLTS